VISHAPSAEARQCAHFLEHLDGVAAGVAAEAAALRATITAAVSEMKARLEAREASLVSALGTLEQAEVKRIETTEHDLRQRHQALHEAMGAAADLLGYRGKKTRLRMAWALMIGSWHVISDAFFLHIILPHTIQFEPCNNARDRTTPLSVRDPVAFLTAAPLDPGALLRVLAPLAEGGGPGPTKPYAPSPMYRAALDDIARDMRHFANVDRCANREATVSA
jgi:hypothetical protein